MDKASAESKVPSAEPSEPTRAPGESGKASTQRLEDTPEALRVTLEDAVRQATQALRQTAVPPHTEPAFVFKA